MFMHQRHISEHAVRKSIFALTNSESMRSWVIGGRYDRPIARRLEEEAGVPRRLCGQKKLVTAVLYPSPNLPSGEALRQEFLRLCRQKRGVRYEGPLTRSGLGCGKWLHVA